MPKLSHSLLLLHAMLKKFKDDDDVIQTFYLFHTVEYIYLERNNKTQFNRC